MTHRYLARASAHLPDLRGHFGRRTMGEYRRLLAHCPDCGVITSVFVRSQEHSDLVCKPCREGASGLVAPDPTGRPLPAPSRGC